MQTILSISIMTSLGVFFAVILSFAYKRLKTEEDPRLEKILSILPGTNCGACGFGGCKAFAESVLQNNIEPMPGCTVGGQIIQEQIAEILGREIAPEIKKKAAVIHCGAKAVQRKKQADYQGQSSCKASNLTSSEIGCSYGCLGYGDCCVVCPFDAITMVEGLPKVNLDKCTACGRCIEVCPRKIISLDELGENLIAIVCSSTDTGRIVKDICPVGCTACHICEKIESLVFKVENNLSRINCENFKKTERWQEAIDKCPTKCIAKIK